MGFGVSLDSAELVFDGHAGKIAHVLVGTRQLVEQLVASQLKGQPHVRRQGGGVCLWRFIVIASALAQSGVRWGERGGIKGKGGICVAIPILHSWPFVFYLYLLRFGYSECQFVAVNAQFHGVAHRGKLYHRHLGTGNHAHIKDVLAQRSFSADARNASRPAYLQFAKFHLYLVFSYKSTRIPLTRQYSEVSIYRNRNCSVN